MALAFAVTVFSIAILPEGKASLLIGRENRKEVTIHYENLKKNSSIPPN